MITFNLIEKFRGKRGIIVFSDPAGAKACLAIAKNLNSNDVIVISDREYDFYIDFGVNVISSLNKNINEFIVSYKPDFIFIDRQRHFGLSAIKSKIPLIVHLRGDFWKEMKKAEETSYKSFPKRMALKKWYEMGDECFKNSQIILPICKHLEKRTLEYYPDQNTEVLYQGINPKNWYKEKGMKLNHPCIGLIR